MPKLNLRFLPVKLPAFTLIEVMLTVSIISILTAAIIPTVGNFADANIASQAAQNIAADIENAKFKALSGVYDGDPTSLYINWGFYCNNASSYTLSSYHRDSTTTMGPVQRNITVNGGATLTCSGVRIVFQRLTGQVLTGANSQILVTKGTKNVYVRVSSNGSISLVKP